MDEEPITLLEEKTAKLQGDMLLWLLNLTNIKTFFSQVVTIPLYLNIKSIEL